MAALHAGIPISTSIAAVNRQCSSGLTAVNQIATQIVAGQIDIGIGASRRDTSSPPRLLTQCCRCRSRVYDLWVWPSFTT